MGDGAGRGRWRRRGWGGPLSGGEGEAAWREETRLGKRGCPGGCTTTQAGVPTCGPRRGGGRGAVSQRQSRQPGLVPPRSPAGPPARQGPDPQGEPGTSWASEDVSGDTGPGCLVWFLPLCPWALAQGVRVRTCVDVHGRVPVHRHTSAHTCAHANMYAHMCLCAHVCGCTCLCVCV